MPSASRTVIKSLACATSERKRASLFCRWRSSTSDEASSASEICDGERVERVEHFLRQEGRRLEDECAPHLVADRQRQEEKCAVCFDVEWPLDARRQRRHRNGGHPPDHRLQPAGGLGFDRVARSRIARRDQFDLVLRGQQEPNAALDRRPRALPQRRLRRRCRSRRRPRAPRPHDAGRAHARSHALRRERGRPYVRRQGERAPPRRRSRRGRRRCECPG